MAQSAALSKQYQTFTILEITMEAYTIEGSIFCQQQYHISLPYRFNKQKFSLSTVFLIFFWLVSFCGLALLFTVFFFTFHQFWITHTYIHYQIILARCNPHVNARKRQPVDHELFTDPHIFNTISFSVSYNYVTFFTMCFYFVLFCCI